MDRDFGWQLPAGANTYLLPTYPKNTLLSQLYSLIIAANALLTRPRQSNQIPPCHQSITQAQLRYLLLVNYSIIKRQIMLEFL
ncbi:hypothetical protein [Cylindrospermum stagnale]|uniref:hypothetical protein n=1 Tax=Cylindrospermum stagnale TaxID=142864 RepID=UPI0002D3FFF4|nr:hypothetical protein [Cylindrospermum stagnale]